MQTDFEPVHLQQANAKLDRHGLSSARYQKHDDAPKQKSFWKKFLGLFKTSPFVLPEELYKHK